nr:cobalt-precorrin-6A reductase [uncultured Cohaesibacter sp.]
MGKKILILGGTTEARHLVEALLKDGGYDVTLSLAGALGAGTEAAFRGRLVGADLTRLQIRLGGFGGVEGLADYLRSEYFDVLVDATHPYAVQISHNAFEAATSCDTLMARLERPAWDAPSGSDWIVADDIEEAARLIPSSSRVLLAVGRQSATPFHMRSDCQFLLRSIAPADKGALGENFSFCLSMPGKTKEDEIRLLQEENITCLVTKNSGGDRSFHKVAAAQSLTLKIVMITRPHLPVCCTFNDLSALLDWLTD